MIWRASVLGVWLLLLRRMAGGGGPCFHTGAVVLLYTGTYCVAALVKVLLDL
jgi:hypothetical protein